MASTGQRRTHNRAEYLPVEAQHLRQRIASLYREMFCLREEAVRERDNSDADGVSENDDIWDLIEMLPDDIRGYAQRAELRVPVRYPERAAAHLKQLMIFEAPGVMRWYIEDGQRFPLMCRYLEAVDYLRFLTLDYIDRFDKLTLDLKSF